MARARSVAKGNNGKQNRGDIFKSTKVTVGHKYNFNLLSSLNENIDTPLN